MNPPPHNTKRLFIKLGTCSRTLFYILNREFGHPQETEECASDPLAGGIMRLGYQCGMLWGSTLAAGAEAYRRSANRDQALVLAMSATQSLMASFLNRIQSANCSYITSCDFNSKLSMTKYLLTGKFISCFKLAEHWAPEAIKAAAEGMSRVPANPPATPLSCASVVAQEMGAGEAEIVMVAGLAGGLALSGNACGALGAAIWLNTLSWCRKQPRKSAYNNIRATKTLTAFYAAANNDLLCHKIAGRRFDSIADHTEFIKNGGCEKLIKALARSCQ